MSLFLSVRRALRFLSGGIWSALALVLAAHVPAALAQSKSEFEPSGFWYDGDRRAPVALAEDQIALIGGSVRFEIDGPVGSEIPNAEVLERGSELVRLQLPAGTSASELFEDDGLQTRLDGRRLAAVYYQQSDSAESVLVASGEIVVIPEAGANIPAVIAGAKSLNSEVRRDGPVAGSLVFGCTPGPECLELSVRLYELDGVKFAFPNWYQTYVTRLNIDDPLYPSQWHLENTGQNGVAGEDANVQPAWDLGVTGDAVTIAVVDDGVEVLHEDLVANSGGLSSAAPHIDLIDDDANPTPPAGLGLGHGTSVAGIAAASGSNATGVTGAAFDAKVNGIRLIGGPTPFSDIAQALTHNLSHPSQPNDVFNNSWGPGDDGNLYPLNPLVELAMESGVTDGRRGRGSNYIWAAGNGLGASDNSNYDGLASSRYTISVAASDDRGEQSSYSERGANVLVNAPSSGNGVGTTTTDLSGSDGYNTPPPGGNNNYTRAFGGTSSAAPLAAGVVGLMLDANAGLGWRDVQRVLALSAERNDTADADWTQNGAGHWVNHKYGFGRVDAGAAVALARGWANAASESNDSTFVSPALAIPDGPAAPSVQASLDLGDAVTDIESVELVVDSDHTYWGDLLITLVSPAGTSSILSEPHNVGGAQLSGGYRFGSVRHLGESAQGTWTVTFQDFVGQDVGTVDELRLTVYGTGGSDLSECNGLAVTVNLVDGDSPTAGDDVILGTAGNDVIDAAAGNDTICALAGDDRVDGAGGDDWIDAGPGADSVTGRAGDDTIFGDEGDDRISGGGGVDRIDGEEGSDTLFGQIGNDVIDGGPGADFINGGPGDDDIVTGSGATVGTGLYATGGGGGDTITGGPDADDLRGSNGVDIMLGAGGDDVMSGGFGRDVMDGGAGDDTMRGQDSRDTLSGGSGNDRIEGGIENDTIDGNAGNDTILGNGGDDTLRGGGGNDQLIGGSGDDDLDGQVGTDDCNGQSGTDSAVGCETTTGVP